MTAIPDRALCSSYVSGLAPSILYGLPKIHKLDFSTQFEITGKFLQPLITLFSSFLLFVNELAPFRKNDCTVINSSSFASELQKFNYNMASFDTENKCSNIPLFKTFKIILPTMFNTPDDM